MLVRSEFEKLGVSILSVDLGSVQIVEDLTVNQFEQLRHCLQEWGLELMEDRKSILIDKVKTLLVNLINSSSDMPLVNYSVYIAEKLNYDYTYLSNLFSRHTGQTIQQFIIQHKIEKAKELLGHSHMTLTEIAYILNYSSVAHLSNQFKKITGMTPSEYKKGLGIGPRATQETVRSVS
jgi:AraC-like DNA-binding protein